MIALIPGNRHPASLCGDIGAAAVRYTSVSSAENKFTCGLFYVKAKGKDLLSTHLYLQSAAGVIVNYVAVIGV